MRADEDLRTDVLDELIWEPAIDESRIEVKVENGEVILGGFVPSYYEKIRAEDAAERVLGIRNVKNRIDVELSTTFTHSDEEIAEAAGNILKWNTSVPEENITLNVEDGWIILEGNVEWNYQKEATSDAVRFLSGVLGVTNRIKVQPGEGDKSSEKTASSSEKIKKALERDALVNADEIEVTVESSTAILAGTVRTREARKRAENAAWSTPGVLSITNNITVETPEMFNR